MGCGRAAAHPYRNIRRVQGITNRNGPERTEKNQHYLSPSLRPRHRRSDVTRKHELKRAEAGAFLPPLEAGGLPALKGKHP
jgi:hypothetical protein